MTPERAQDVEAWKQARLTRFNKHKSELLDHMRHTWRNGSKSSAFDEIDAWNKVLRIANFYLDRVEMRDGGIFLQASDRTKRLNRLAAALGKARDLTEKAMLDWSEPM